MANYYTSLSKNQSTTTLDALYQDLDSFIHELSVDLPPQSTSDGKNIITTYEAITSTETYPCMMDQKDKHDSATFRYYGECKLDGKRDSGSSTGQETVCPESLDCAARNPRPESTSPSDRSFASVDAELHQSSTSLHGSKSSSLSTASSYANPTETSSPSSSDPSAPRPLPSHPHPTISTSTNTITNDAPKELTKVSVDEHTVVYTTRSSSLNRQMSTSSEKYAGPTFMRSNNLLSPKLYSTPTSPLATHVARFTSESLAASHAHSPCIVFPNYTLMSELGEKFIEEVYTMTERRKIFCSAEYPTSFSGEEAMDIIRSLFPTGLPDNTYRKIARSLIHTTPALIYPLSYSEKSVRNNTLYDSPHEVYNLAEEALEGDIPQGVFTQLTPCYSNFCLPGQGGCYAPCCPNRSSAPSSETTKRHPDLQRHTSLSSSMASSHDTSVSRAWSASVSREILQRTPDVEIKRQEAIHEIIYTEEDYVRDLNLLDELYATPLRTAQCLEESYREAFCDNVFNNYMEILQIHRQLYRDLRDHQSYCQSQNSAGFVDKIGDIFLRHLPKFKDAYTRYGPHVVLAEYAVKKEMGRNILFQNFIHEKQRQAECRKLPFRHFIILPVTRLQRYPLLIGAILKKTADDHPDKQSLLQCADMLKSVASEMDERTAETKNTLRICMINDRIVYKPNEMHDLRLLATGRKLLHEGILTRRSHMVVETVELHVFLFDHMLVLTKLRKNSAGEEEYHITKRPIPLELLHVQEATEGFSLGLRAMSSTYTSTFASHTGTTVGSSPFGTHYPLLIHHLGRHGADHLLHAENAEARLAWKEQIVQAKAAMERLQPDRQVFEIRSLSDTTFTGATAHGASFNHGKITCSVPFVSTRGIRMIAIGTLAGIWMGIEGDTNSIHQVLSLQDVQQLAVLEEHRILIILADKSLYAYALDPLDPTLSKKTDERPSQKIAQHVSYFNAGICNNRTLVIAMKKRGMDSHFKAFEPICGDLRDPKNAKFMTSKSSFFHKAPSWFKVYKEFYIGADSSAIHFLKARVVVVCTRGFEIIDLEQLHLNRNIPDLNNPDYGFVQQRGDELKPLAMFRCKEHYLLCYNDFAFLVDSHGSFIRDAYLWIAWEGTPHSIAFYYPYVIAFDSRFIEVRHVETGQLVQVLAGVHMRCLQFTNSAFAPVIHGCMAHPFKPEYQYVFQLIANFEPPV
ncbi:CNH domain-containing protein [Radiomyces spectabilis]|uniref:CNH domain-containing protein n=1 Tax=Radiomyces spectabilis TaxID=64574 RepID=UPI002220BF0A|nr:CNH domain-containing protein [Radiomyces spectabilis]KAI8377728.1 CNH domain-containing protein [Radiomyces spectabilis]